MIFFTNTNMQKLFVFVVLMLFSAFGFREFRNIQHNRDLNKNTYVNNGNISTSFVWTAQPFGIFSEDFHLYFVRNSGLLKRGFFHNTYGIRTNKYPDLRNIIQVVLTIPVTLLGEKTDNLYFIYVLYISLASLIIYLSLPKTVPLPIKLVSAVFLTYIIQNRVLRFSTNMFSTPLFFALLSQLLIILYNSDIKTSPNTSQYKNKIVSLILFILLFLDFWTAIVALIMVFASYTFLWIKNGFKSSWLLKQWLLLVPPLLFIMVSFLNCSSCTSDRIGFGVNSKIDFLTFIIQIQNTSILFDALPNLIYVYLFAFIIFLLFFKKGYHSFILGITLSLPIVSYIFMKYFKLEAYQLFHVTEYMRYIILYLAINIIISIDFKYYIERTKILNLILTKKTIQVTILISCLLIMGILGYKGAYLRYIMPLEKNTKSWGNLIQVEALLETSKTKIKKGETIALINQELAPQFVHHTDGVVILPSGFPLHSMSNSQEIADDFTALLLKLKINPSTMDTFLIANAPHDQSEWQNDRKKMVQFGLLYHLFHRSEAKGFEYLANSKSKKLTLPKIDYVIYEPALAAIIQSNFNKKLNIPLYTLLTYSEYINSISN